MRDHGRLAMVLLFASCTSTPGQTRTETGEPGPSPSTPTGPSKPGTPVDLAGPTTLLDLAAIGGDALPSDDGGLAADMAAMVGPLSCTAPATYNTNGGRCGVDRWSVKTGSDADATLVSLVPQLTTIAALGAIPAPKMIPANSRIAPTETTVWEVKNVTLTALKSESDSDYHLVLTDGQNTVVAEVPYPGCVGPSSPFGCFITHARAAADKLTAKATVTVIGVGFFDTPHGQTGDAPNSIELHPVLAVCAGQDCTPN